MRSSFGYSVVLCLLTAACGGGNADIKAGPMPAEGSFTGVYFSPQYGEMHMVQNGSAVVGKYKQEERSGSIQGEAEGDLLRFVWTEHKAMVANRPQDARGHGYFRYMVDPANGDHVLKGRWGLDDDDSKGGEWNAYKSRKLEPDLEKFGGDEDKSSGGEKATDSSGDSSGGDSSGDNGGDDKQEGDDIF
jgi:hypothetical protein